MVSLFDPYDLAGRALHNRIVMAPMTRARAPDEIATDTMAGYYAQRASAGLIVSEGSFVSPTARGFLFVPGIYSHAQATGWEKVTSAIHARGGTMFAQLWHVGRVSHVSLQPDGRAPVSSTDVQGGAAFAYDEAGAPGIIPASAPRRLETAEVTHIVDDFVAAAARAIDAGFDGVEIHGANGYLFEQFLNPVVNDRTDRYGGSIANRSRLLCDTAQQVAARIGAHRVGVRLSPFSFLFDMPAYDSVEDDYLHVAAVLGRSGIAYIHLMDQGAVSAGFDRVGEARIGPAFLEKLRAHYSGTVILAGGLDAARAQHLVETGLVDLVAMGRPFIANPDLVDRIRMGSDIAEPNPATFYGGDARGYTDYPALTSEAG